MIRISESAGIDLQDETRELSKDNKVIGFHFFGECPKCKEQREVTYEMFTDSCGSEDHSFTGWSYRCSCGHIIEIWEGVFDCILEAYYEADLVETRE